MYSDTVYKKCCYSERLQQNIVTAKSEYKANMYLLITIHRCSLLSAMFQGITLVTQDQRRVEVIKSVSNRLGANQSVRQKKQVHRYDVLVFVYT